jgi:hypothetical protein
MACSGWRRQGDIDDDGSITGNGMSDGNSDNGSARLTTQKGQNSELTYIVITFHLFKHCDFKHKSVVVIQHNFR